MSVGAAGALDNKEGKGGRMRQTVRLTAAQAMVRWLSVQMTEDGERFIDGVWAIFGHGNVAGLGEALHGIGDDLPTWRGQNEQTMAHAAIAFAKGHARRRAQAVTASIGPGATNMVTAAALAHVNRLPLLLIPGADRPAPRVAGDDRSGRLRPGLPGLLPGRAGRGP